MTVVLINACRLLSLKALTVVRAALLGEAMWWCNLVGVLLDLISTCVVFSMARSIRAWVVLLGRFRVSVVLLTVLVSRNMQVGLSLDMVAIVLTCVLLLTYIALLVVDSKVLVCVWFVVLMVVPVNSFAILVFSRVGAPGTACIMGRLLFS